MDTLSRKRIELLGYDIYRRCSSGLPVSDEEMQERLTKIKHNYPNMTLHSLIRECQLKESDDKFKLAPQIKTKILDKIIEENIVSKDILDNILFDYIDPEKTIVYFPGTNKIHMEFSHINNVKHGEYKEYNIDGTIFQIANYEDGILNGITKEFEMGKLFSVANFKDGKLEGETTYYYPNGNIKLQMNFENNVFDGLTTFYNENGKISRQFLNDNNGQVWQKNYYPNGSLREEIFYNKNRPNRIRAWKPDGTEIRFPRLTKY